MSGAPRLRVLTLLVTTIATLAGLFVGPAAHAATVDEAAAALGIRGNYQLVRITATGAELMSSEPFVDALEI